MNLKFFDAHTHVQIAAFKEDYKDVIHRALDVGVGMVNVGTQKDTSQKAIAVAHEFKNELIYATVGLHPSHVVFSEFHDAQELENHEIPDGTFDYEYYKNLALDQKVVAIGECGLDYYRAESGKLESIKEKQKEVFLAHIQLAHEIQKPLMIHCRDAFTDLIEILRKEKINLPTNKVGIIHFFTGTKDDAKKLLDLGFSFTFGGAITYEYKQSKNINYAELIDYIPLNRILSETDAPYVAPVPYRGKRNEPAYVIEVVKKIAEIKNMNIEQVSEQILENTKKILL